MSAMRITPTAISDVQIIEPVRHGDRRGYFAEMYNQKLLVDAGIDVAFVQDNQSLSAQRGVVRGLHYQLPPFAQDKLVRVLRGSVLDVAVDIRRGSPTFGKHVAVELSADNFRQLFVPVGFAHGFVTLEDDTELFYKVSDYYAPDHERGIQWNDPDLAIDWPVESAAAILSDKDLKLPPLSQLTELFD
jgi:dTDP-4-dehydrorhamnose 3,5-epimerase